MSFRQFLQTLKHLMLHGRMPPVSNWVRFKDYIRVHPTALIDPSADIQIINPPSPPRICLEIGERSHIFSSFFLLTPEATIRIGKRCQLGHSTFNCAQAISVGDDVLMAWHITLMDNDSHSPVWLKRQHDATRCYEDAMKNPKDFIRYKDWTHVPRQAIQIGDRAWIGFGASILKGSKVGNEAVIGACAVVTKDVPSGATAVGNPARILDSRNEIT